MVALDRAKQPGDAVNEWFAADYADIGPGKRLGGEVLAAAETDLEPDIVARRIECSTGTARDIFQIDGEFW